LRKFCPEKLLKKLGFWFKSVPLNRKVSIKIAIVGAGIAGLTCGYELQKRFNVTIFEKNGSAGGRMSSEVKEGFIFDRGANFLIKNYKLIPHYLKELGIGDVWQPMVAKRFALFRNGKLYPSYSELQNLLFRMKQISFASRLRLALFLYRESKRKEVLNFYNLSESDAYDTDNAFDYVSKRAGLEVANFITDPFTSTFHFHSSHEVSSAAAMALAYELTQHNEEFVMYHTRGGMQVLPEALAKRVNVKYSTPVHHVQTANGKVEVDGTVYDAVVLACTADVTAKIYRNPTQEQAKLLKAVEYAATINVSYQLPRELAEEFSFVMVPFIEGGKIAEYTNESLKGDDVIQGGQTLVNIGLHEAFAKELMDKTDAEVFARVKEAFLQVCPPLEGKGNLLKNHTLQRWPVAIPKYKQGYVKLVRAFMEKGQGENNVFFCGDYLNSPWTEGSCGCGQRVAKILLS
jgi:protoporphyrinogen/coproporphyrinogen III oxidase